VNSTWDLRRKQEAERVDKKKNGFIKETTKDNDKETVSLQGELLRFFLYPV